MITIFISTSALVNARHVGQLSNFRVTVTGNSTQSLKKLNSSNTIINLQPTKDGKQVHVRTIHSGNGRDLGGTTVWTANRKSYSDNSVKGGHYHLKLSNKRKGQPNFTVYGSWSPDSY